MHVHKISQTLINAHTSAPGLRRSARFAPALLHQLALPRLQAGCGLPAQAHAKHQLQLRCCTSPASQYGSRTVPTAEPDHVSERKARTSHSSSCCTVPSSSTMQKTCRVWRLHNVSLRSSRSCAAYAQRCALSCLDRGSLCRLWC